MERTLSEAINEVEYVNNYQFIWGEPLVLVTLGGSWAYGTNKATSDIDVRGIMFEPKESILGLSNFEQKEKHDSEKDIDIVIYGLRKMVKLLLGNNPNCIEMLCPNPRNILYASDIGKKLIVDNPELPLLIFVEEEVYNGEYCYCSSTNCHAEVKEIVLYGDMWLDKQYYRDELIDNLADDENYSKLSDAEFYDMIDKKVSETEFIKAIVVYVD